MAALPPMPRSLQSAIWSIVCFVIFATWVGWLEPPWQRAATQRDEWADAHAIAVAGLEDQRRKLLVLEDRDGRTQLDLNAIREKLDEMAMVLYSLERRSR
jgi:hypothetical protein